MKQQTLEITSFKDANPEKNIWYKYFDDTFVSVICKEGRKSHLRRKHSVDSSKRDNKMCQWHSDWQYLHIEENYGIRHGNPKTYEIPVTVDGIDHRIDSMTKNVAIEFQHSLDVPIEEMNQRFEAHQKYGLLPYLVLDFTDYSFKSEMSGYNVLPLPTLRNPSIQTKDHFHIFFSRFEKKWCQTKYFDSDNLFVDFKDTIVRLSPHLISGYITMKKEYFISNLHLLEMEFERKREHDKQEYFQQIERANRNSELIKDQNRKYDNELRFQIEKEKEQQEKRERAKNEVDKIESPFFKFYRKCLNNKTISPFIDKYAPRIKTENVTYKIGREEVKGLYFNRHIYEAAEHYPKLRIEWMTVCNISPGSKEFVFNHSEIKLIQEFSSEIITFLFTEKNGFTIIDSVRIELLDGYLHSFKYPALYIYESNKKKTDEYYLFNRKVEKRNWEVLGFYFETGVIENKENEETISSFFEPVIRNDIYGIYKDLQEYRELSSETKSAYLEDRLFNKSLESVNSSNSYKRLIKSSPKNKRGYTFNHR